MKINDTKLLDWLENWLKDVDPPCFIEVAFREGKKVFWLYRIVPFSNDQTHNRGVSRFVTIAEASTLREAIKIAMKDENKK